ncbi:MAG: 2-hydroxyacid dehydrogenase [Chloroflexota bacterium]|nr:2-hydroxyacid dehydrogenase [Dehalococcoidia bacterium]MDW8254635.1 2-hydroxyacid dehydrogenase [Chloroflexota bacterium]
MKIAVFSTKPYDRASFERHNAAFGHELHFFEARLRPDTAALADGFPGVCVFVNDRVDCEVIARLAAGGVRIIATRSAGYNQIDLEAADRHGIVVARVPAYSPNAVSEFTVGLILTLGRQIHRAYNRVREHNFELTGLVGFELRDKTIGIIGTGRIGTATLRNLSGFGARLLAYDVVRNAEAAALAEYVDDVLDLARQSDIISLHVPLTPQTYHLVDEHFLRHVKPGVFLVNTSRGALLETRAVIEALKAGTIGFLAIDVYEEEEDLFYQDLSNHVIADDVFARLLTFPNVLVTGHQAFLTDHALRAIAETTLENFREFEQTGRCTNAVTVDVMRGGEPPVQRVLEIDELLEILGDDS